VESNFAISILTVHILMCYTGLEKLDYNSSLELIENCQILQMDEITSEEALKLFSGKDFEDCLQITTCFQNNVGKIVILDKDLAKKFSEIIEVVLF